MLSDTHKSRLAQWAVVFLAIVSIYFVFKAINEVRAGKYIGTQNSPSVISVNGSGEVSAAPDIATITFTARGHGTTTKEAQAKEAEVINKALDYLKSKNIADKDIKTSTYYAQPQYDYGYSVCTKTYCPPREPKIIGYDASQTVDVKIHDLDSVGDIFAGLGTNGVNDISGPNFTIDDEDKLKDQARADAITQARDRADVLAKQLGVRIIKVSNFQENGGGGPIYYAKDMAVSAQASNPAPTPSIPPGENKIKVDVTITYEIRYRGSKIA